MTSRKGGKPQKSQDSLGVAQLVVLLLHLVSPLNCDGTLSTLHAQPGLARSKKFDMHSTSLVTQHLRLTPSVH